jgi:hypothetical protein
MSSTLKTPEEYMPAFDALRKRNKFTESWVLHLERRTNRHRERSGGLWGWYEISPLGLEVGYWGTGRDDLAGVDIAAWNKEAERLSRE